MIEQINAYKIVFLELVYLLMPMVSWCIARNSETPMQREAFSKILILWMVSNGRKLCMTADYLTIAQRDIYLYYSCTPCSVPVRLLSPTTFSLFLEYGMQWLDALENDCTI